MPLLKTPFFSFLPSLCTQSATFDKFLWVGFVSTIQAIQVIFGHIWTSPLLRVWHPSCQIFGCLHWKRCLYFLPYIETSLPFHRLWISTQKNGIGGVGVDPQIGLKQCGTVCCYLILDQALPVKGSQFIVDGIEFESGNCYDFVYSINVVGYETNT